jgi:hypothetical protein
MVAGTFCGGRVTATFAQKYKDCRECDFYKATRKEEGPKYILSVHLQEKLKSKPAPPER